MSMPNEDSMQRCAFLPLCAALAVVTQSVLAGCASESSDCTSNDDCPSGKVCNLLAGVCIADTGSSQDLVFSGSFECTVTDYMDTRISSVTDVVGGFDGQGIRFDNVVCSVSVSGDELVVLFLGVTPSSSAARELFGLTFHVAPETFDDRALQVRAGLPAGTAPSGRADVNLAVFHDADLINDLGSGSGSLLAVGESGVLRLTGGSMPDDTLAGEVDVRLSELDLGPTPDSGRVGEPCQEQADCGVGAGLLCVEALGSICAGSCQDQAECDPFGGVCSFFPGVDGGFCLAPCTQTSDCAVEGHSCAQTPGSSGASCVFGFIAEDDPEALGAPCSEATLSEDCPNTECLVWSGGEGMCTLSCESTEDCGWYLDIDTTCLPVSGGSVCLQRCTDDSDCPEHLECIAEGSDSVCVIPRESTMPDELPPSATLDAAIARFADMQCALEQRCNQFLLEIVAGDQAYCEAQVERIYTHAATLPSSGLTLANLDYCAGRLASLTCEEWHGRGTGCVILGRLADGAPCSDSAQCMSGWCQGTTFTCGACEPRAITGEPCMGYSECAKGFVCVDGECARMPDLGEGCDDTVPCFGWATCLDHLCRANNRQLGQSCGPEVGQPYCELDPAHLVCVQNVCRAATVAAAGEPCPPAGWCGESGACMDGTCVTGPGPGDACSDSDMPCRWPSVCFEGTCLGIPTSDACGQ